MVIFLLCIMLLTLPATPVNAAQPAPTDSGYVQDVENSFPVNGDEPDSTPAAPEITVVDLSPLLMVQAEQLSVLKSCNTLLLSLALFEFFRFGRGLSKRVFRKGVSNG